MPQAAGQVALLFQQNFRWPSGSAFPTKLPRPHSRAAHGIPKGVLCALQVPLVLRAEERGHEKVVEKAEQEEDAAVVAHNGLALADDEGQPVGRLAAVGVGVGGDNGNGVVLGGDAKDDDAAEQVDAGRDEVPLAQVRGALEGRRGVRLRDRAAQIAETGERAANEAVGWGEGSGTAG